MYSFLTRYRYDLSFMLLSSMLLWFSGRVSFLFFHTTIEMICVIIGMVIFIWSYASRKMVNNCFMHFLAISILSYTILDFFHILSYNGMNMFTNFNHYDTCNTSTQFWICARIIHTTSLFISPLLIHAESKQIKYFIFLAIYSCLDILLTVLIFTGNFPVMMTSNGLTQTKKAIEYSIIAILVLTFIHIFYKYHQQTFKVEKEPKTIKVNHQELDGMLREETKNSSEPEQDDNYEKRNNKIVFVWLVLYLTFSVVTEVLSTLYTKQTDNVNRFAHIFKYLSSVCILRIFFDVIYYRPFNTIKKELEQKSKKLLYYNSVLAAILNKEETNEKLSPKLLNIVRQNASNRFQSLISHEIRTPLNAIIGLAELLNDKELPDEEKDMVNTIYHSSVGLVSLLNDLLDLGKIESREINIKKETLNITSNNLEIVKLFEGMSSKKNIKIKHKQYVKTSNNRRIDTKDSYSIFIKGDTLRYCQIIRNLLSNAVKFTPVSGTINVITSIFSHDDFDYHTNHKIIKKSTLCIEIVDTGPGIPDEKINTVFTPFKQMENINTHVQGTGLGLSIAKGLANCMDADIKVYNNICNGCTFEVIFEQIDIEIASSISDSLIEKLSLKRSKVHPTPSIDKSIRPETYYQRNTPSIMVPDNISPSKTVKILLVEDSIVNQKVQSKMLDVLFKQNNIELQLDVVENGLEALSVISRHNFKQDLDGNGIECNEKPYDIVLMDQMMPIMGGEEATSKIRQIEIDKKVEHKLVIIAQTGLVGSGYQNKGLYDEWIEKPIVKKKLLMVLKKFL